MNSARNSTSKKLTEDRKLLIKALLEAFEKQGGRVIYPAIDQEETWLEKLHVPLLIESVKTNAYVDVGKLMSSESSEGGVHEGMDPRMESDGSTELVLNIPQLTVALDQHELQQLAFLLFCLFCTEEHGNLIVSMRRQLELSESCAEDIIQIVKRTQLPREPSGSSFEVGADLLLQLLKDIRPNHFRKFRDFLRWRDVVARVLVQLMKESVTGANLSNTASPSDVPLLLANLKGAVRRMCFQEEGDFEEREYADAVLCVASIAQRMIPYSKSGFSFTWGLRIRLWETYLMALFESFEEDVYIDEMKIIKTLILEHLAPRLQISSALHDACFAWVHFKQLSSSHSSKLIPHLKNLMTTVNTNDPALEELDRMYVAEMSRLCFASLIETLMDYHAKLPDPEVMSGMVDLFLSLMETVPSRTSLTPRLEECITSSCSKAFQRMQLRQNSAENRHLELKNLADETKELYETELLKYTGELASFCQAAAAIAAKAFHDIYGQELNPVLYELKSIPEDVVQMLKAADELESVLMREIAHEASISRSVVPWNVMDAISELLFNWVDAQLDKIKEWRERLCQEEAWQPQSTTTPVSASALEFKKLLEESITLVFSLDLTFPDDLVNKFVAGLAAAIGAYAKTTMNDIRGEEGCRLLVPRLPELTRYKKDLAENAALKEERSLEAKPNKRHSRLKSILADFSVTKMVPLIEDSENYQWFNSLKTSTLVVRINSLHFLKESIPELITMIATNLTSHCPQTKDETAVVEPLQSVATDLEKCVNLFCTFLGTKVVFWDGRIPWLEQLYRHHVSTSRLDFILADLYKTLMDINSIALTSIRNRIVHALLEACVRGLRRVLLDGGPYRLFKSGAVGNDRELIEEDLKKLKDLFNDEEEGLPMSLIEGTIKPIFEILLQMSLSTSNLIQLAEDAKKSSPRELKVFTQILGHRADRAASKWLKKVMKTPKKVKSKF